MNKHTSKSTLLANFTSLSFVQVVNYLFPLLLIPYIVRVIGPSNYGAFAFAIAVVGYFAMFTDWGISLYAPREIALVRENRENLSRLVSAILYLKLLSILFLTLLFVALVFMVPRFKQEITLFLFASTYIFMSGLSLNWFFQGVERMTHIAVSQSIAKILWAMLVILLIRTREDYAILPLTYFLSDIAGKLYLIYKMFSGWNITLRKPILSEIKKVAKYSFPLFVSNISIKIYTGINTVLLGFLTNNQIVGYYSLAEKITKALLGVQSQISVVFYPHISARMQESWKETSRSIKKGATAVMLLAIPLFLLNFTFSHQIILLIGGKGFLPASNTLKILSFLFVVVGLSNIFGIQILLPMGKRKEFMKATLFSIAIITALDIVLIPPLKQNGAAISFLVSELVVLVIMLGYYLKFKTDFLDMGRFLKLSGLLLLSWGFLELIKPLHLHPIVAAAGFGLFYAAIAQVLGLVNLKRRTIPA